MSNRYIITIDQGTTGSRVFLINEKGAVVASVYEEFTQYFPKAGWVEHDANEIWASIEKLLGQVIEKAGVDINDAAGIGITNQRETTVVWQKSTGKPVYKAIVWQCRRTSALCDKLKEDGYEQTFKKKTGLVIDAYFSGTKIRWILDNVPEARELAEKDDLLFGTIDTWLLYKLTGGREHKTDYTNASRTLLYNIHEKKWDEDLLKIMQVPATMLPAVQASSSDFGATHGLKSLPDGIKIYSMIGDQQAALYGQLCHEPGTAKNTYGTGCFVVMNLGDKNLESEHGLVTTLACDAAGKPVYALEASIFIGGAVIQWLRDGLQIMKDAAESEPMADGLNKEDEVVFIPAFAGLGAPYWDQDARGAIFGLTRDTTKEQIARAALKSIALQSYDAIEAMKNDSGLEVESLKVDGGATKNGYLMRYQAGILQVPVIRPRNIETTVLGAAYLAGLAAGIWNSAEDLKNLNPPSETFHPAFDAKDVEKEIKIWQSGIKKVLTKSA